MPFVAHVWQGFPPAAGHSSLPESIGHAKKPRGTNVAPTVDISIQKFLGISGEGMFFLLLKMDCLRLFGECFLLNDIVDVFFGGSYCLVTLRCHLLLIVIRQTSFQKGWFGIYDSPNRTRFHYLLYVNLSAHSSWQQIGGGIPKSPVAES